MDDNSDNSVCSWSLLSSHSILPFLKCLSIPRGKLTVLGNTTLHPFIVCLTRCADMRVRVGKGLELVLGVGRGVGGCLYMFIQSGQKCMAIYHHVVLINEWLSLMGR